MDGFRANEGIIVLGATNRPSELDKALLRPGRFDTKVEVTNPDIKGRKAILELYLSKVKYSSSLDVDRIAQRTVGFSGADLQNLVNTAAVRAAQKNREHVTMSEIEYAYDKQGIFKNNNTYYFQFLCQFKIFCLDNFFCSFKTVLFTFCCSNGNRS